MIALHANVRYSGYLKGNNMDSKVKHKHGSPYDRGRADSYYGRNRRPHFWPEGTGNGIEVTKLTPEEHAAYHAGYDDNEREGDFKQWE